MLFYILKEYIITYSIITFYNLNLNPLQYYIRHSGRYLYQVGPYQRESISPFLKIAIAVLRWHPGN